MSALKPAAATAPAETMTCPYCAERISLQAVVCKHCQRDLLFFAPVQRELKALGQRLATLEAQNLKLVALLAEHWRLNAGTATAEAVAQASEQAEAQGGDESRDAPRPGLAAVLGFLLLPVACLVAAHGITVMLLDLSQLWLRIVSIVLPLLFGLVFVARFRVRLPYQLLMAIAIAVLSVAGMAAVVAAVDGVPFLPQDRREWGELAYYAASIAFSHMTGILTGILVLRRRNRGIDRVSQKLAEIMAGDAPAPNKIQRIRRYTDGIRDFITLVTPILTAIVSVATGLGLLKK